MRPALELPDFLAGYTAEEIHNRMMETLPSDIDKMPGGFPYDFTMPAAQVLDEFVNWELVRTLMCAFPQYAWGQWLDLQGVQVHLSRNLSRRAHGEIIVTGTPGTTIPTGTAFCTVAVDSSPSLEYVTSADAVIGDEGTVTVDIDAYEGGTKYNVDAGTIILAMKPNKSIASVINPKPLTGGTEDESDESYAERILLEYANSKSFIGNDTDYIRWARAAGAGDCIVVSCAAGPGTVKLVLVDANGEPADETLIKAVYDYIVSPDDRSKRILPTACAKLICVGATTVYIDYSITGLLLDATTDIEQIKKDFKAAVKAVHSASKDKNLLRYNDVRPIIKDIPGVIDFDTFTMNSGVANIKLAPEEYPATGNLDFTA